MIESCEIEGCGYRAAETFEDMEDGCWLAICRKHINEFTKLGRIFDGKIDLRGL